MKLGPRIDYKTLRKVNAEAARLAVTEYLSSNGGNISEAAAVFAIQRATVYDILSKQREGDLTDRSRAPKTSPRRTAPEVEDKVIELKNQTRLGPKRLAIHLDKYHKLKVAYGTIRHILSRNKARLTYPLKSQRTKLGKREFVDWYSAKPFEIVQVDVKFIRDQKALTTEQILHLDRHKIPNYQWDAIDVNSRFKIMAYSREKTWTNGLCFYLWLIAHLRSHGVTSPIAFTVDHGEEFGGKSWVKITELRKLISGFGCRLIQNHKGHPEENAHLERSHRTDDEEFYIPRVLQIDSEARLLDEALGYNHYYNNFREHSSLDYSTPFAHLKRQLPDIDDNLRFVVPILMDNVSTTLGPWSGYHLLAQYRDAVECDCRSTPIA